MEQRSGRSDSGSLCLFGSYLLYPGSSVSCWGCLCAVVLAMEYSQCYTKKCKGNQLVPKGVLVITFFACSAGSKNNSDSRVLPGGCLYSKSRQLFVYTKEPRESERLVGMSSSELKRTQCRTQAVYQCLGINKSSKMALPAPQSSSSVPALPLSRSPTSRREASDTSGETEARVASQACAVRNLGTTELGYCFTILRSVP